MRKIIVALFFGVALGVAHGQIGFPYVIYTTVDPTGIVCGFGAPTYVVFATGTQYTCKNGLYAAAGGSGGSGTVTSVGLSANADFTVTGTPVTTAGTLAFDWATPPTGTGAMVRATSPTLVTPVLGTPASGILTNVTGLPISTGVSGLGTGVATLLGGASSGTGGPAGTASPTFTGNVLASSASATLGVTATGASASYNTGNDLNSALTAGAGHILYRCFGQGLTTNNSTCLTFNYTLAASATNFGYFSLFGGVSPLAWYGNGGVSVGASTTTPPANGLLSAGPIISGITKFTATGCTSITSTVGNGAAGQFVIGANTCTVVITINGATGMTASNGWSCHANDHTTLAGNTGLVFLTNSTTTATLTVPATAAANDVIDFSCAAY